MGACWSWNVPAAKLVLLPKSKRPSVLLHFGDVDEELLRTLYSQPQQLVICSTGGDAEIALAAADILAHYPLTVVATGSCYSAALIVLTSATVRVATENTRFMWHRPSSSLPDGHHSPSQLQTVLKELCLNEDRLLAHLAKTSGVDRTVWQGLAAPGDYYFDCRRAVELGVLHHIVEPTSARPTRHRPTSSGRDKG